MAVSKPLLLLDNASMLALLHQGCFRLQEISFEEVKAILEMHGSREVVRCFSNAEIEQLLYKHLDVAIRNFNYAPVENMAVDQDAIAFRLYVTPSETQPSIRTEYGNEATKVQNLYVPASFSHGSTPMRGHPLNKFPPAPEPFRRLRRFSLAGNLPQENKNF